MLNLSHGMSHRIKSLKQNHTLFGQHFQPFLILTTKYWETPRDFIAVRVRAHISKTCTILMPLKGTVRPKWKFCLHSLTLKLFQILIKILVLMNTETYGRMLVTKQVWATTDYQSRKYCFKYVFILLNPKEDVLKNEEKQTVMRHFCLPNFSYYGNQWRPRTDWLI